MRWYFVFFLVSGFCSLVYEVVWLRLAMADFGVTTPLVSIVLSLYMAGLGLGCWVAGRLVRRFEREGASTPLRFYALAELLIGLGGLVVRPLLIWGHSLLEETAREVHLGDSGYYLAAGFWIALTLLPWCACMGSTFPLAMAAIQKSFPRQSQRSFSYLYLANVVGAVLGTLVPAFVLIELLGFRRTLYVAATLNGVLAAGAVALSFALAPSVPTRTPSATPASGKVVPPGPHEKVFLGLLFATGLITLAMEVVWIRLFTPYLGNLVYAFATILALYLAATFLGSQAYRLLVRRPHPSLETLPWLVVGLLGLLPLASADPHLWLRPGFAPGVFRVAAGLIPFSALVGFLTPLLVDRYSAGNADRAGRAYAVNILGCLLGPLLAGFCLLPWLGERWSLITLTLPLFAIGLLFARAPAASSTGSRGPGNPTVVFACAVLVSLLLVSIAETFEEKFPQRQVRRDHTATVIAAGEGWDRQLLVNGTGMTTLNPFTKMMAHLPLAFLSRPPQNGLVIAFGMGTTFRSMLSWEIPSTVVELVPSVPLLFGYFHPDGPALLRSPRARIVIDDGRRFLERSAEQYDVITVDPPPPVEAAGSSLLYAREFYLLVKKRLRGGGIFQQWLLRGDPATNASVARALRESFPYVRAFRSSDGLGCHFLASTQSIPNTSAGVLAARLPPGAAADLTEWGPHSTGEAQFHAVLAREVPLELLLALAPEVPALQDDRPVNEYFLLRRTASRLTRKRAHFSHPGSD